MFHVAVIIQTYHRVCIGSNKQRSYSITLERHVVLQPLAHCVLMGSRLGPPNAIAPTTVLA